MESSITDREEWTLVDREDTGSGVDAAADSGSGIPFSRISVWTRWALGSVIGFAVPMCRRILRTEDAVAKAAEGSAEAVEKIAKATEKIASEIADELPDGGSLKEKALRIEQICEEVDRDAERAEIFLHKVLSYYELLLSQMNITYYFLSVLDWASASYICEDLVTPLLCNLPGKIDKTHRIHRRFYI
ncbi:unnamed protein product [Musa textilis]